MIPAPRYVAPPLWPSKTEIRAKIEEVAIRKMIEATIVDSNFSPPIGSMFAAPASQKGLMEICVIIGYDAEGNLKIGYGNRVDSLPLQAFYRRLRRHYYRLISILLIDTTPPSIGSNEGGVFLTSSCQAGKISI